MGDREPDEVKGFPRLPAAYSGRRLCCGHAVALLLHAIGDKQKAPLAAQLAPVAVQQVEEGEKRSELEFYRKWFEDTGTPNPRHYKIMTIKPGFDLDLYSLPRGTGAVVQGISHPDGCIGHAFSVFNGFIYDSA